MSLLSDPVRVRRITAGVALIACPLAGVLAAVFDGGEGTDTPGGALYDIAATNAQGIWLAGLLMMLSALLTVPTALALLHLSSGRGVALAHVGVVFLLLGGLGHMGFGTWQLMVARMPEAGDRASLAAYFDQAATIHTLLVPAMMSLIVGLILLAIAARRSGVLPTFVPAMLVTVALFDLVAQSTALSENKWIPAVSWTLAFIGLGSAGLKVLGMSDQQWATLYPQSAADVAPYAKVPAPAH